ncbi:MAG TPA: DUF488 family protein [Flavisolibacter sp.]|nr:DUF488 family protein [Flavisolibacter sp.]
MVRIKIKCVYDKPLKADGYRIFVDRLWPENVSREATQLDEWAREIAPSDALHNWFDHLPEHWWKFQARYIAELDRNKFVRDFAQRHKNKDLITLVYSTRYDHLTHAIILKQFLEQRIIQQKPNAIGC